MELNSNQFLKVKRIGGDIVFEIVEQGVGRWRETAEDLTPLGIRLLIAHLKFGFFNFFYPKQTTESFLEIADRELQNEFLR